MATTVQRPLSRDAAVLAGPALAIIASWLLSLGGSGPNDVVSLANTTLFMTAITLAAAVIDWRAGISTSVIGAIALNYFHTEPYRTLRITDRQDLLTVGLLAALGLIASAAAASRTRVAMRRVAIQQSEISRDQLLAQDRNGIASAQLWNTASIAIVGGLASTKAAVVAKLPSDMARISRNVEGNHRDDIVTLPRNGAAIELHVADSKSSWLVVSPTNPDVISEVPRRTLAVLADATELCLDGPS